MVTSQGAEANDAAQMKHVLRLYLLSRGGDRPQPPHASGLIRNSPRLSAGERQPSDHVADSATVLAFMRIPGA